MRLARFKPQYTIPCWVLSFAFVLAALFFKSLTNLFGVIGYFAVSYALIISLYIIVVLYIRMRIKAADDFRLSSDLSKVYKDLRIGFFFPAESENKSVEFKVGLIICLFVLLPILIYKRIQGYDLISYVPIAVIVGLCVYGQARILFEMGCSTYSKGDE